MDFFFSGVVDMAHGQKSDRFLRGRLELLGKITRLNPVTLTIIDKAGTIKCAHPDILHLAGIKTDNEIIGFNIFRDGKDKSFMSRLEKALNGEIRSAEAEHTSTISMKTEMIRYHLIPLHDPDGSVEHVLLLVEGLARERAMEEVVRESEAKYRLLSESVHDIIWQVDRAGRILYLSLDAKKILQSDPDELIGRKFTEFLTAESRDRVRNLMKGISGTMFAEKIPTIELDCDFKGKIIHCEVSFSIMRDRNKRLIIVQGIARDISRQKQMESLLRHSHKMEAVGRLTGGISHDFNNLLTGIMGNLEMALMEAPENIEHYLTEARDAANQSANLIRQLLVLSRKSKPELKPRDVNGIAAEVRNLARRTIDRRIEIHLALAEGLPPIRADESQITTLLMNLCLNARDAIKEVLFGKAAPHRRSESFTIDLYTRLATFNEDFCRRHSGVRPGRFVALAVTDNGCGMDERTQRHLFDPFYTTKQRGKGTGLGLAMVHEIVKKHAGWIDFHSTPGEGTTFEVYFPATDQKVPDVEEAVFLEDLPGGTETLLVIDDEPIILNLVKHIMERLGYAVLQASNGRTGIDLFTREKERIKLVILDLSMPHLSGLEILGTLKSVNPELPVIISSGYNVTDLPRDAYAAMVPKPYRPDVLARTVRRVLDEANYQN